MILMITQDLMMSSTVSSVAKTMDEPLKTANSVAAAERLIQADRPRLLLVDLQTPNLQTTETTSLLQSIAAAGGVRSVAYAQHVNKDLLDEARGAGFDQILTRGQMHNNVADVLRHD
jgi:DNA-binding NarL/FixJ family response regulator